MKMLWLAVVAIILAVDGLAVAYTLKSTDSWTVQDEPGTFAIACSPGRFAPYSTVTCAVLNTRTGQVTRWVKAGER